MKINVKINLNRRMDSIFGFEKWLVTSSIKDMVVEQITISYIEEVVTFLGKEGEDTFIALLVSKDSKIEALRLKGNISDWGEHDMGIMDVVDLDVPPFFRYEFVIGVLRGRGII